MITPSFWKRKTVWEHFEMKTIRLSLEHTYSFDWLNGDSIRLMSAMLLMPFHSKVLDSKMSSHLFHEHIGLCPCEKCVLAKWRMKKGHIVWRERVELCVYDNKMNNHCMLLYLATYSHHTNKRFHILFFLHNIADPKNNHTKCKLDFFQSAWSACDEKERKPTDAFFCIFKKKYRKKQR